jgi:hypothetical protein
VGDRMVNDPRAGIGGYVQDATSGGYQLGRAKAMASIVKWVALLLGEPSNKPRQIVLANRQVVDRWRTELAPLGVKVGIWVVHGTDPVLDAQHYQGFKHLDLAVCNCEREYVEDPSRSKRFLEAVGPLPPAVLSTNGNPSQKPMDYRCWEKRGAWLATQAYWQFNVVSYLTPKVAHQLAYLPAQVNVGPSDTSWWYRVWVRGKGNRWTQAAGTVGVNDTTYLILQDGQTSSTWHARTKRGSDGGLYLTDRVLLANGTRDVGRVLGFSPKARITPHISNENGDTGRPSPADITAKISACPTRKVATGVFTLDNASDEELRAMQLGVAA